MMVVDVDLEKLPRCGECGGTVTLAQGTGRTREIMHGVVAAIPDDFYLPTCSRCGETFSVPEVDRELDVVLLRERVVRLEQHLIASNHLLAEAVQSRYSTVSRLVERLAASDAKLQAARKACMAAMARGAPLGRLFDELNAILSPNAFEKHTLAHIFTAEGQEDQVALRLDDDDKENTP